jgi:hypothetical protein
MIHFRVKPRNVLSAQQRFHINVINLNQRKNKLVGAPRVPHSRRTNSTPDQGLTPFSSGAFFAQTTVRRPSLNPNAFLFRANNQPV